MSSSPETIQKAQQIYERITAAFEERTITPNPVNYQLWYEYYLGNNPRLRQEMDSILDSEFGFDDRVAARLFNTYIKVVAEPSQLDLAFKRLVDAMVRRMEQWAHNLEQRNYEIALVKKQLDADNLNQQELKNITASMITTTENMQSNQLDMQQQIQKTTLEINQLRKELIAARAEALTDDLTQISNRKAFDLDLFELVEEINLQAAKNQQNLCLILADIDNFKTFNDKYGHLIGDSVLRYFAGILQKLTPKNGKVYRYGGEEFAILLTEDDLQTAHQLAEKIRVFTGQARLKRKDSDTHLPVITASFGVANYQESEEIEDLIDRADKLLYQAKTNGRNQVLSAPVAN